MKHSHYLTKWLGLKNWPLLRKTIVAVVGLTIIFVGLAMIVLPGPAMVVIPLGLLILASEFVWARRLVRRGKHLWRKARAKLLHLSCARR